jgi:membrane-associated phospholipid phosphatase
LALFTKNKWIEFLLFSIALIVGYSRVYLSQHFFIDIYAGSIIGVSTTLVIYFLFRNLKAQWLDKSLINSFNSN